jgi:hypothetical protein
MVAWKVFSFVATAVAVAYTAFIYGGTRTVIISVVSGTFVCAFMYFQKRAAKHRDGWRYLTPSPIEWFCFIAVPLFVALLSYVYFFIGSGRHDAEFQMLMLKVLIVAFSVGGVLVTYMSLCVVTRWNDDRIQQSAVGRHPKDIRIGDIVALQLSPVWQTLRIESADGSVIRANINQNGTNELIEFLIDKLQPPEHDMNAEHENVGPGG